MGVTEEVIRKLRQLPLEKQQEVLEFVESLKSEAAAHPPANRLKGLWADLNVDITQEDIAEARREMWGNFPREFPE